MSDDLLSLMRTRLNYHGGIPQQDRMIKDKRRSLDRALLYSYQAAKISKLNSTEVIKALINPDNLKPDYDNKVISVGFEHNFKVGDVFTWNNTETKWIIYLQDLTELAYFRGEIRKCTYEIKWKDADGNIKSVYAAVKGPVETKINSIQKYGIDVNVPNYSLSIIMPNTEDTRAYFKRYNKFYLQDNEICWRVEAADYVTSPGVLEINAVEYYANEDTDDIEEGIVNGLIIDPIPPEPSAAEIVGEVFIKPKKTYTYTYSGTQSASWTFDTTLPIEYTINDKTITIKWLKTYTGQFILSYGTSQKTIVIESLFE